MLVVEGAVGAAVEGSVQGVVVEQATVVGLAVAGELVAFAVLVGLGEVGRLLFGIVGVNSSDSPVECIGIVGDRPEQGCTCIVVLEGNTGDVVLP